jgi:transposase
MPAAEKPMVIEKTPEELRALVERVRGQRLEAGDADTLATLVASYGLMVDLLRDRQTTIARLRELLFGPSSERRKDLFGDGSKEGGSSGTSTQAPASEPAPAVRAKAPVQGHGRHGVDDFPAAVRVQTEHGTLHEGDGCPHCRGRVYARPPQRLVRIVGLAPFAATVYEQERLRCNLCGDVFTAPAPAGVGEEKHDASAVAMVALLRYGLGMPFYRVAALQESAGIPLPASTQWDLVHEAADALAPLLGALVALAARGEVLHNDDTTMTVLSLKKEGPDEDGRSGVFTSAVLARVDGRTVALYGTGRAHAGERLAQVLAQRPAELPPPKQMCDALERNVPEGLQTILGNCLVHMRRQFVDVVGSFPTEVRHVIDELALVYMVEEAAKGLSAQGRLELHQLHSAPVMERLAAWFKEQEDEKRVEPNSGLGKAIAYATKRWERFTLFLRVAGAPLDNNACEQILKRAILHRKNSLFYKTTNGARVGDLYMSLITTCKLAGVDAFRYLTQVLLHKARVATHPDDWLPWHYEATLVREGLASPGP